MLRKVPGLLLLLGSLLLWGQGTMSPVALAAGQATRFTPIQQSAASSCLQPPSNVDLMTLSDAQLAAYGLPNQHILAGHREQWAGLFAHAKTRVCGSHPGPANQMATVYTSYAANWAGYMALDSRGTYREAGGNAVVPTLRSDSASTSEAAFWAGVGGDNGGVLVQAGIETTRLREGSVEVQTQAAWWEVAPANEWQFFNMPISQGDQVDFYVSSNYQGDGYDYFYTADVNKGTYASTTDSTRSDLSDSATGECVAERPSFTNGGDYFSLADFGTIQINSCFVYDEYTGTSDGVKNWNTVYKLFMTNNGTSSGRTLASPGSTDSTGYNFPVTWKAGS